MKINRKYSIAIGVLFLLAMASYMIGSEIVVSSLDIANGFANINVNTLKFGIVLEFINNAAVVGIASLMYPLLRKKNEWIATGYVASRIIESCLLMICSVCVLVLAFAAPETMQQVGGTLLIFRDLLFQMAMISLAAGSIFMCYVLYSKFSIPRILSLIGIIGYAALFLSGFLVLFGNSGSDILYIPGALFEIAFPILLIVKGFAPDNFNS
jgi:hypothetical protein